MTIAHIAGIPLEETLATMAPAVGIFVVLAGARLRGLAASLRPRKPDKQTR